jgi:large subunit ribosomal protein L21e
MHDMGKSNGPRRKSRSALTKSVREKGKLGLSRILARYEIGDKVVIKIDSGIHKGMPHKRYQGKIGTIIARRGRAYIIEIPQTKIVKKIIALPEHLMRF